MYYYLKGKIVDLTQDKIVIDVNGIGFEVMIINQSDFEVGEETTVYTLHIIKEDDELLVGFKDLRSKEIFTKLISVKGIGPKTAITALNGISIDHFIEMINNDDLKALKKLPGIGPKAAAQIILDLKGSIKSSTLASVSGKQDNKLTKEQEDAKNVLKSLGFKAKDIDDVFSKMPSVLTASEYINEALKKLGK